MRVSNVHERELIADLATAAPLIDRLASPEDVLWPGKSWPRMRFDRPLRVGARGGHGPIRYFVESYRPGREIRFRFTGPRGFDGWHGLLLEEAGSRRTRLRHILQMTTHGTASFSWPLVFRPLHDALVEDALDCAEDFMGIEVEPVRWSLWVRLLRAALLPRRPGRAAAVG
jgi:hypothetical protein